MTKNIFIYGIIAGVVVSIPMLYLANSMINSKGSIDFDQGIFIGYASMLIAFTLVYIGVRNYRNNYTGGLISFGKAFKVGIMIVLVASTLYVAAWLVDYYLFIPDFGEKYSAHMIDKLKATGASQVIIDKEAKNMASFAANYKNPFFNAIMTYMEILPVGLVVTLISSIILKRNKLN
jgi:hypothetical protein